MLDSNNDLLEETSDALKSTHEGKVFNYNLDLMNDHAYISVINNFHNEFGRIHGFCNNAAASSGLGELHTFSNTDFDKTLDLSFKMLWLSLKCEIQYLTEKSLTASIVNISSNAALRGYANNSIYAASKAAVNSLTLSAAKELGKKIGELVEKSKNLSEVKPFVEKVIGKEIYPTYSFSRLYRTDSILEPHFDRPACEVSLTLQVYSDGDPWPIFVCDDPHVLVQEVDPSATKEYTLEDGDAVLYNGCDQIHWREKYTGKEQHQIFLHYVVADGPHKDHKDDALLHKELDNG